MHLVSGVCEVKVCNCTSEQQCTQPPFRATALMHCNDKVRVRRQKSHAIFATFLVLCLLTRDVCSPNPRVLHVE